MKRCPYCERTLKFWQFKCRLCNRFIWRIPQILIVLLSVSIVILAVVLVIDHLAVSQESIEKKNDKQPGAIRQRSRPY